MGRVLALVPKPPIAGFPASQNQRPHRPVFNHLHNMLVSSRPKVWPQGLNRGAGFIGCLLQIGLKGDGDKPPGVVVKSTVIVAFVEFMQPEGNAEPEYPTL